MIMIRLSQRVRIMLCVFVKHVLHVFICIRLFYHMDNVRALEADRPLRFNKLDL